MKNSLLVLIIVISSFQIAFSQTKEIAVLQKVPLEKHFNQKDYNGGTQSWSFDQDNTGILYVANNEGLLEFDGKTWNKFSVPFTNKIRAVKVDNQNKIFVGGQGQIGFFNKTKNGIIFTSLLDKLPQKKNQITETWKILKIGNTIFFNTESELFKFDNNRITSLKLPGYLRYAFNVHNKLFAQFYNKGLYKLVGNEFVQVTGTIINSDIVSILPTASGYFCFTKSGKVYALKDSGFNEVVIPVKLGTINTALKLKSGDFVIGTQNDGLYILNTDFSLKEHLTKGNGLSNRTVNALYEDNFQNLWVALNNGIDYLELSLPFSLINEEVGVEGAGYAATEFHNQIYLGTSNGVFIQEKNRNLFTNSFKLIPKSEGQVYNFSKIHDKLILNCHEGAFEIQGNKLHKINDIGSWKFMETPNPNLILEGNYRGISFFNLENGNWKYKHSILNFDESSRILEFENDSTLWMSHGLKGVYKLILDANMNAVGKIELYGKGNGFPSNRLISVYSLDGKLIFTSEKGIFDYNPDSNMFTPNLYLNKLLGTEHVNKIISNNKNTLYYIQNLKFGKLYQKKLGLFVNERNIFNHINKYINDDLPNISIIDKNNILLGAKEGFILYNPDQKIAITKKFNVLLRSLEIKSATDDINTYNPIFISNLKVVKNQSVKFKYASPYFDGFEEIKYSYRLLPIDKNWSKWTNSTEKEYTHLPFDNYKFEVKAQNIYGIESSLTTFSFEVLTPWYYTKWAKVGYLVFGILLFLLLPLIQRKKHNIEKSIITESKEKALKIKDEEIHKLTREKLKSELDLKNDQLTTITMEVMKNNEFIQDVKNKIVNTLDKSNSKQELKKIVKTIDKELSNYDSWDQFAYHFDQVHGNYLKKLSENNISLSPREIKLAAFLRMNMSSKEISNVLNITIRGVELARYRLRKKLNLKRDQNLVEYLIELDKS